MIMIVEDSYEIARHCSALLDSFDAEGIAPEDHINQYLKIHKQLSSDDQCAIIEIFIGCTKYHLVLDVVLDGFYNREGKHFLLAERNLYSVILYLVLFQHDNVSVNEMRRWIFVHDINKMYTLLNFFLDEKKLLTWIKDEWNKLYDESFVKSEILSPLMRRLPELLKLLTSIKNIIEGKPKSHQSRVRKTVPKPFALTKPKPRSIPVPEIIPKVDNARSVPKTTYNEPQEQVKLKQLHEDNRRKAMETFERNEREKLACSAADKSEKTRRRMEAIEADERKKLDFDRRKSHKFSPTIFTEKVPIKLNAATILREAELYKKKEKEEIMRLEQLESGAREASDFLEWQARMRRKDLESELAEIEKRRLEGKLSHEEAILARHNLIKENKARVADMKKEAENLMQEYWKKKMEEEKEARKLVEDVLDTHKNAKRAKKRLQEYKAKIVQGMTEDRKELMRRALDEAEAEIRQKMALISQIRAMQAVPITRQKLVNLGETPNHGLLQEMSITELNERLSLLKLAEREEEENKRNEIMVIKQERDEKLKETLQTIERHHDENSAAAAMRQESRKLEKIRQPPQDEQLIQMSRNLEEKRAERKRLAQEMSASAFSAPSGAIHKTRHSSSLKKILEENKWREVQEKRERAAKLETAGITSSKTATRIAQTKAIMSIY